MYTYLDISSPLEKFQVEIEHETDGSVSLKFGKASVHFSKEDYKDLLKAISRDNTTLAVAGQSKVISRFRLSATHYSDNTSTYVLLPRKSRDINDRIIMEHVDNLTGEVLYRSFKYSPYDGYVFDFDTATWKRSNELKALEDEALEERNRALKECGALTAYAVSEHYEEKIKQLADFPFEF